MTRESSPKKTGVKEKPKRIYLTIPITKAMQTAIVKASRKATFKKATWARQFVLRETDYDPETDPDIGTVSDLGEKD